MKAIIFEFKTQNGSVLEYFEGTQDELNGLLIHFRNWVAYKGHIWEIEE